jgi:hypothetical protein
VPAFVLRAAALAAEPDNFLIARAQGAVEAALQRKAVGGRVEIQA